MRTLRRLLAPHARTSWLTFAAVAVATVLVAIVAVVLTGSGRVALAGVFGTWFAVVVALAAFLDAILVPGNPDARRQAGHAGGWSGTVGVGGDFSHGGGSSGGDGGSC